jgi:hypothetical protein
MSCSKPVQTISFAEIIRGRDATVRVTHDHLIYAIDLVMVMTGLGRDDSGKTLRRLSDETFSSDKLSERNTGGSGNSKTKLVSFQHALELVMVLPGNTAKETRVQFTNILKRYMAGDQSLVSEIHANASSTSPIAQMARESLKMTQGDDPVAVGFKRRREELELLKLEEEIKDMTQSRIITASTEIERIRDPTRSNLDDRTRLMIQDALQNSILNTLQSGSRLAGGQALLTNGMSSNVPISIGSVAGKLGYKVTSDDAKRIGLDLRKRYIQQHGNPPPKHDQLCDGRVTLVNSYTEQDRPLVEQALHAYFKPSESDGDASE